MVTDEQMARELTKSAAPDGAEGGTEPASDLERIRALVQSWSSPRPQLPPGQKWVKVKPRVSRKFAPPQMSAKAAARARKREKARLADLKAVVVENERRRVARSLAEQVSGALFSPTDTVLDGNGSNQPE